MENHNYNMYVEISDFTPLPQSRAEQKFNKQRVQSTGLDIAPIVCGYLLCQITDVDD